MLWGETAVFWFQWLVTVHNTSQSAENLLCHSQNAVYSSIFMCLFVMFFFIFVALIWFVLVSSLISPFDLGQVIHAVHSCLGDISAEDLFRMFFGGQVFTASTWIYLSSSFCQLLCTVTLWTYLRSNCVASCCLIHRQFICLSVCLSHSLSVGKWVVACV